VTPIPTLQTRLKIHRKFFFLILAVFGIGTMSYFHHFWLSTYRASSSFSDDGSDDKEEILESIIHGGLIEDKEKVLCKTCEGNILKNKEGIPEVLISCTKCAVPST